MLHSVPSPVDGDSVAWEVWEGGFGPSSTRKADLRRDFRIFRDSKKKEKGEGSLA